MENVTEPLTPYFFPNSVGIILQVPSKTSAKLLVSDEEYFVETSIKLHYPQYQAHRRDTGSTARSPIAFSFAFSCCELLSFFT